RRRHTRSKRDWSSDVCSSDLLFVVRCRFRVRPFVIVVSGPHGSVITSDEGDVMKYVLLLMGNLTDDRCGESEEGPGVEEFMAFDAELERAGVLAGGFGLTDPEEGTSLSKDTREAEPVITAGPYAESREFVGGTVVI